MKLSETHIRILEEGADGHCYRGVWRWTLKDNTPVTRQVNAMKRNGLIEGMYFTGGRGSMSATDKGRDVLKGKQNV